MSKVNREEIVRKDDNLYGYVTFVAKVREKEHSGMGREKSVEGAIKECIKEGILAEYLENNASEVINMLFQEWNWEDAKSVWDEETEKRVDAKWQSIIAGKDAALVEKDAEIAALKLRLGNSSV